MDDVAQQQDKNHGNHIRQHHHGQHEVKEKKTEWGDPCPVHGTSRHSWDECRLKNSTSCPYCLEGIKEGMLNKHVSICKGKRCYKCGCLGHMRAECGVRSSGKRRRESDRSLDRQGHLRSAMGEGTRNKGPGQRKDAGTLRTTTKGERNTVKRVRNTNIEDRRERGSTMM